MTSAFLLVRSAFGLAGAFLARAAFFAGLAHLRSGRIVASLHHRPHSGVCTRAFHIMEAQTEAMIDP